MRKVVVEAEVSLDGILGGDNEAFWKKLFDLHSADVLDYLNKLLLTPDALVMGRKTYEGFAAIWPTRQGEMADKINGMPKYVASRTQRAPLQWNATLIKRDVAQEIKKRKDQPGRASCNTAWGS